MCACGEFALLWVICAALKLHVSLPFSAQPLVPTSIPTWMTRCSTRGTNQTQVDPTNKTVQSSRMESSLSHRVSGKLIKGACVYSSLVYGHQGVSPFMPYIIKT